MRKRTLDAFLRLAAMAGAFAVMGTSPAFVCDFEDGFLTIVRVPGEIDDDDDWDDDLEDIFD
jgi:hypothetical protein